VTVYRRWTWTPTGGFILAAWGSPGLVALLLTYAQGDLAPGASNYHGGFPTFVIPYGLRAAIGWIVLLLSGLLTRRRTSDRPTSPWS
jgi:hypothetical protein